MLYILLAKKLFINYLEKLGVKDDLFTFYKLNKNGRKRNVEYIIKKIMSPFLFLN